MGTRRLLAGALACCVVLGCADEKRRSHHRDDDEEERTAASARATSEITGVDAERAALQRVLGERAKNATEPADAWFEASATAPSISSSVVAPPSPRGAASASGRLPPEVIQRIVRSNFGKMKSCYEAGLRSNPSLKGKVTVTFIIARDGTVGSVGAGGDLPDAAVVSCITRAFYGLKFPEPDGGVVKVSYPLVFAP